MDIYLLDQLLRGRIYSQMRVLDAGCGGGRNIAYLLREGFEVYGVDREPEAIAAVVGLAEALSPAVPKENFRVADLGRTDFEANEFDLVISNAVLHFADDASHFDRMVREMWRVLAPGGLFFSRLATSIGIADRVEALENGWFALPDGSSRFLVDEQKLLRMTESLGGALADPLKTTLVQNLRSMTTWVLWKPSPLEAGGPNRSEP